jgi:hypothetical protein
MTAARTMRAAAATGMKSICAKQEKAVVQSIQKRYSYHQKINNRGFEWW